MNIVPALSRTTILTAALLLAACGGSPSTAPSSATAPPSASSAPSGSLAASASTAPKTSAQPSAAGLTAAADSASGAPKTSAQPAAASSATAGAARPSASPAQASASAAGASVSPASVSETSAGGTTINVAQDSSKLDVKMREVLAGNTITTDATESTKAVTGTIVLDGSGAVQPGSKISMDLRTLQSDRSTRDNFIKGRFVLDTGNFPTVEFVPTEVQGLDGPPPSSGSKTFKLLGNATVKGVTKPMSWDVTATFDGQGCSGTATSSFKLSDFGLSIPRLPTVLSVEDQGNLALTFQASKTAAA